MHTFRRLVVGSLIGALAAFVVTAGPASAAAGDITTFSSPLLDVDLVPITAGPDGNLWFGNNGPQNKSIGRITPSGSVTTFSLGGGVRGIVAGPDGNVWFSHTDADQMGMVTPTGAITTFADPAGNINAPRGITPGPDGNLWFASAESDRIGRITTAGVITTFADPENEVDGPQDIAAGSDGNLWFTSQNNGRIGRITTTGDITTFVPPVGDFDSLTNIAAGSDGNLWFTSHLNDRIGRITTAGVFTPFADPEGEVDGPRDITNGPDGSLWFTNSNNHRIARITTAGDITTFTDPAVVSPAEITTGPDGNLWFTIAGNQRIGYIEPPADVTDPTITVTTPPDGAVYTLNQAVTADYECEDELGGSGLASCAGTVPDGAAIDTGSVGSKTFTVDAADNAGNDASVTHSYQVVYAFSGFFSPIDNNTVNSAKAGQTVPIKWRLTDANGVGVADPSSFVSVTSSPGSGSCSGTPDAIEEYGGTSGLQYLGDGYWQFNWKTPKSYAGQCRTLKLNLDDGTPSGLTYNTANFKFK